jgi:hypothetical protein
MPGTDGSHRAQGNLTKVGKSLESEVKRSLSYVTNPSCRGAEPTSVPPEMYLVRSAAVIMELRILAPRTHRGKTSLPPTFQPHFAVLSLVADYPRGSNPFRPIKELLTYFVIVGDVIYTEVASRDPPSRNINSIHSLLL